MFFSCPFAPGVCILHKIAQVKISSEWRLINRQLITWMFRVLSLTVCVFYLHHSFHAMPMRWSEFRVCRAHSDSPTKCRLLHGHYSLTDEPILNILTYFFSIIFHFHRPLCNYKPLFLIASHRAATLFGNILSMGGGCNMRMCVWVCECADFKRSKLISRGKNIAHLISISDSFWWVLARARVGTIASMHRAEVPLASVNTLTSMSEYMTDTLLL